MKVVSAEVILFWKLECGKYSNHEYLQNINKLIVSSLEYLPHSNFQKRIVSAETIRGNTATTRYIKSVNLKYITVGRLDDDMIVPPSDGAMFILID